MEVKIIEGIGVMLSSNTCLWYYRDYKDYRDYRDYRGTWVKGTMMYELCVYYRLSFNPKVGIEGGLPLSEYPLISPSRLWTNSVVSAYRYTTIDTLPIDTLHFCH